MPELPEVEFARQQILTWTARRAVVRVVIPERTVVAPRARRAAWRTAKTGDVLRRGKTLLWRLANRDEGVIVHLGMTGSLMRLAQAEALPKHTRVAWLLDDDSQIVLDDPRRFGRVVFGRATALARDPGLNRDAVDPIADRFTVKHLADALARSRAPVKTVLMDQARVQGLGNIYAAEACFRGGVDPRTPAGLIAGDALRRLHGGIAAALRHGISVSGPPGGTVRYVTAGGDNPFLVYDRAGEPCPSCGAPIQRIVQGNRGTWFCPRCQPALRRPPS